MFRCICRNERTTTHDALWDIILTIVLEWDIILTIVLESGTHVQKEVFHLFPHHIRQQLHIIIIRDNFQTLMDIVIVDPTHIDMVPQASMMTTHVVMMPTQEKTRSYVERALGNDFIPLAINMYGCFHFLLLVHISLARVINSLF